MITAPVLWNNAPGGALSLIAGGLFLSLSLVVLSGVIAHKLLSKKYQAAALAGAGLLGVAVFWLLCTNRMLEVLGLVALYAFALSAVLLALTPLYNEGRRAYGRKGQQGARGHRAGARLSRAETQR